MSDEKPRQRTISLHCTVEKNLSGEMTSPRRLQNQSTSYTETARTPMFGSPRIAPTDWKLRYDNLHYEHQLEIERLRLHYEHQLKEKVSEIRNQLKRDYEQQVTELRSNLFDQYQQQLHNLSTSSVGLDQSYGERVREQIRLAEQLEREEEQRRQSLLQQSNDNEEAKRLVNKLHTEGVHVLTLSELLSLRLNGVHIAATEESIATLQKLNEENTMLRNLIGNMQNGENGTKLIKCIADIFRCEQERRLIQIRQHPNFESLEEEIHDMCNYQRDALSKLFSQDRLSLIDELDQTKREFNDLRFKFDKFREYSGQQTSNRVNLKLMRCENYRKSLIYQKRYLLVLLTGYEDTEHYALNEIHRLTGDRYSNSTPLPFYNQRTKFIPRPIYNRRAFNYRFRFRTYARLVIAVIRMRTLARKWARKNSSI